MPHSMPIPTYLHKIRLAGRSGFLDDPDIFVVSEVDSRLEAKQNRPENQIYADGSVCSIGSGQVIIDVGANVGR